MLNNMVQSQSKNLSDASFREEYKELSKKDKNPETQSQKKEKSWQHKESCLKCKIAPLLFKHFRIPMKCIDFCSCSATKTQIHKQYNKICRISLLNALKSYSYKTKAAKLADFKLTINNTEHKLDILKLKTGAIKRYTQPFTEHHLIGTAAFHNTSIFWRLNSSYYLEFRLKSKHCRSLLDVDIKRKSPDIASWWYQCWSVFGIREYTKKSNDSRPYIDVDGVIEHQDMRLKPFLAAHHNDFVHSGDLKKSLNRIALIFWKKEGLNEETEIKINDVVIPLIVKRNHRIKAEISSSEETELRNQLQCASFSDLQSNSNHTKAEYNVRNPSYNKFATYHTENCNVENNESVSNSNSTRDKQVIDNLMKESQIQTETISELQEKVVTLEHEKINLHNEIAQLRSNPTSLRIKTEPEAVMSLKNQIKSLQNELALSQTTKMIDNLPLFPTEYNSFSSHAQWNDLHEDKDEEIRELKDKIKILTNDNQRLEALNKNDRISFHNKMQEYHSKIANEMQLMLSHNDKEKIGLKEEIAKLKEENTNWSTKCRIQGMILNNNFNQEHAANPPSMKRQKLNDGSINTSVSCIN